MFVQSWWDRLWMSSSIVEEKRSSGNQGDRRSEVPRPPRRPPGQRPGPARAAKHIFYLFIDPAPARRQLPVRQPRRRERAHARRRQVQQRRLRVSVHMHHPHRRAQTTHVRPQQRPEVPLPRPPRRVVPQPQRHKRPRHNNVPQPQHRAPPRPLCPQQLDRHVQRRRHLHHLHIVSSIPISRIFNYPPHPSRTPTTHRTQTAPTAGCTPSGSCPAAAASVRCTQTTPPARPSAQCSAPPRTHTAQTAQQPAEAARPMASAAKYPQELLPLINIHPPIASIHLPCGPLFHPHFHFVKFIPPCLPNGPPSERHPRLVFLPSVFRPSNRSPHLHSTHSRPPRSKSTIPTTS